MRVSQSEARVRMGLYPAGGTPVDSRGAAGRDRPHRKDAAISDRIGQAFDAASSTTGTSFEYLLKTAQRESALNPSAKAKSSTATGLFQFIESTWLETMKQAGPSLGYAEYADEDRGRRRRPLSRARSGRQGGDPGAARGPGNRLADGRGAHPQERDLSLRPPRPDTQFRRALHRPFPRRRRRGVDDRTRPSPRRTPALPTIFRARPRPIGRSSTKAAKRSPFRRSIPISSPSMAARRSPSIRPRRSSRPMPPRRRRGRCRPGSMTRRPCVSPPAGARSRRPTPFPASFAPMSP